MMKVSLSLFGLSSLLLTGTHGVSWGNFLTKAKLIGSFVACRLWSVFFPGRATPHIKTSPTGFWGTKIGVQGPADLFRVGYPHSTDSELCGHTRHVNQFQHVISQLCPKIGPLISPCFLKVNKIGLSDSVFVEYRKTLYKAVQSKCVREMYYAA